MTTRSVAQNNYGGAAAPRVTEKMKKIGVEKKTRPALGDIGNVVGVRGVDAKPVPQVPRPATRRSCANIQAVPVGNKKIVANDGDLAKKKGLVRKQTQKKANADQPKPQEIIIISPDSKEVEEKEKCPNKEKSSKTKTQTFTAVLTARSKAACRKLKDQIVDIDAADVENDLAVVEYVEDMYKYYKSSEDEGNVHDYMDSQPEINGKMRAILIDWLVQVHHKLDLSKETLYLTINIVDRYLAAKATSRRELQLVGLGSLLLASKYEEIWAPEVNELVCISDRNYTNEQVLAMEKTILGTLEWKVTVPTPYVFLVRFIKASMSGSNLSVESMAHFLAELGMMNYEILIYCPSMIAASAVYAARCTVEEAPYWTETLKAHTGFSEEQLMDSAKLMVTFHRTATEDPKLRGILRKYSSPVRQAVALLPPAKSLMPAS